jgi:hypothetical protein
MQRVYLRGWLHWQGFNIALCRPQDGFTAGWRRQALQKQARVHFEPTWYGKACRARVIIRGWQLNEAN